MDGDRDNIRQQGGHYGQTKTIYLISYVATSDTEKKNKENKILHTPLTLHYKRQSAKKKSNPWEYQNCHKHLHTKLYMKLYI